MNEKSLAGPSPGWPWLRISLAVILFPIAWFLNSQFRFTVQYHTEPNHSATFKKIQAPRINVWADLSDHETSELIKFLHTGPNDLNLTVKANSTSRDNTIFLTEILRPNKTESLPYLLGESEDAPSRWARVIIVEGALAGDTHEYMVGPLPISNESQILPLTYCYNAGRSNVRNLMPDEDDLTAWATEVVMPQIRDILIALVAENMSLEDVTLQSQTPRMENERVITWASVERLGETRSLARTLLSQGVHVKLDLTTRDSSNWRLLEWIYNGVVYKNTEELRAAIQQPDFKRTPLNLDGDWTDLEDYSPGINGREHPGPVMVLASTPRYGIDMKERFVSWMGFEFYIGFAQMSGISLYDIRFKGERIAYEIGLQEALAHYAGDDPQNGPLAYLDTAFSMGKNTFELVPGYDCPAYATFLDTEMYREEQSILHKNTIALFEYTASYPLQRHTTKSYISLSRNTYFVVRSTSVMGNYDYQFDYIFYLDGSFEVKVRASGYIEGAYWAEGFSGEYGYRVHDSFQTRMHDHVLNFKADLDIAGTDNTLVKVGIEAATVDYDFDSIKPRNTMRLTHTPVTEETGLNWAPNAAEKYILYNTAKENAWGEKRGFEIRPGTGMGSTPHLTIINSTAMGKSVGWAMKDLFITKQKDTEPSSANSMSYRDVDNPLIDFDKFLDGEDTVQEDLVVWFNLGAHHVPHSGDIPNTLFHTSASSVMFTPHNFLDMDASRASRQGVRLELANRENTTYFGGKHEKDLHIKLRDVQPDLEREYNAHEHIGKKYLP